MRRKKKMTTLGGGVASAREMGQQCRWQPLAEGKEIYDGGDDRFTIRVVSFESHMCAKRGGLVYGGRSFGIRREESALDLCCLVSLGWEG